MHLGSLLLRRDHLVLEDLEEFLDSEKDAKSAMVGDGGRPQRAAWVAAAYCSADRCILQVCCYGY